MKYLPQNQIGEDAATFTATHTKAEVDLAQKLWLEKPNKHMNRDTDYHNRLEQEVTLLKRDNSTLETEVTQLRHELSFAHTEIKSLRIENNKLIERIEQLRQAIAVLNDEPTNSL